MESYWIGSVVGQFLKVGGVWAGFAVIAVGVALYLVREYRTSKRDEQEARAKELGALVAELRAAREQTHSLMTNHIGHLASSQESYASFQNNVIRLQEGMLKTQGETLDQIKRLRDDVSTVSEKSDRQHQEIRLDIAKESP